MPDGAAGKPLRMPAWKRLALAFTPNLRVSTTLPNGVRLTIRTRSEKGLLFGGLRRYPHELFMLDWYEKNLRGPGAVIDVGANIGIHTVTIARAVARGGGRVVAFEPDPEVRALLLTNLARNSVAASVEVVPMACSDSTGVIRFFRDTVAGATGTIAPTNGNSWYSDYAGAKPDVIEIPCTTLDDFCFSRPDPLAPVFVKIDVENAEHLVLGGMSRLLREVRPSLIVDGCGPPAAAILRDAGYVLFDMEHDGKPLEPDKVRPGAVLARPAGAESRPIC